MKKQFVILLTVVVALMAALLLAACSQPAATSSAAASASADSSAAASADAEASADAGASADAEASADAAANTETAAAPADGEFKSLPTFQPADHVGRTSDMCPTCHVEGAGGAAAIPEDHFDENGELVSARLQCVTCHLNEPAA